MAKNFKDFLKGEAEKSLKFREKFKKFEAFMSNSKYNGLWQYPFVYYKLNTTPQHFYREIIAIIDEFEKINPNPNMIEKALNKIDKANNQIRQGELKFFSIHTNLNFRVYEDYISLVSLRIAMVYKDKKGIKREVYV